ncbi:bifunctional riboflavin kinase/FAD synthetase [Clostridium sp.]|jgi:riboflavin kinase / FMN adenylyltransferase|uniref:bifunctional riboflavin kinase/FAD synthetase n=1 Tax=Clostridium sp. TaxID=1506 RepID=UPI003A5BFF4A
MMIIEDNFKINLKEKTYIALGSFDGLHLGHMSLINRTIQLAKQHNVKSMVFTFKHHPRIVINKNSGPRILMSNKMKLKALDKAGLDIINMANFDTEFMKIDPENFVLKLLNNYRACGLIVGFNYKFGYKNIGDIELLKELSLKYNFSLDIIPPVKYEEEIVSSSIIRKIISETGDMKKARNMLTRPFEISGSVINGKHLGKKLGFPTANLKLDKNFIIPYKGVYYTIVKFENKYYRGITNVGCNPTTNDRKLSIETNILDFSKDIYNKTICVFFIERIRDEVKFDSLDDLKTQLQKDRDYAYSRELEINL